MNDKEKFNQELWNRLLAHRGHSLMVAVYGDPDEPANVSLECEECGEVVLDAELYTICARDDGEGLQETTQGITGEIAIEIKALRADAKETWDAAEADRYEARADALEWVLGRLTGANTPCPWVHY